MFTPDLHLFRRLVKKVKYFTKRDLALSEAEESPASNGSPRSTHDKAFITSTSKSEKSFLNSSPFTKDEVLGLLLDSLGLQLRFSLDKKRIRFYRKVRGPLHNSFY